MDYLTASLSAASRPPLPRSIIRIARVANFLSPFGTIHMHNLSTVRICTVSIPNYGLHCAAHSRKTLLYALARAGRGERYNLEKARGTWRCCCSGRRWIDSSAGVRDRASKQASQAFPPRLCCYRLVVLSSARSHYRVALSLYTYPCMPVCERVYSDGRMSE